MSQALQATGEERDALRELTERLLGGWASDGIRRFLETPAERDDDLWRSFARLGLAGIIIPESYGGGGGSFLDGIAVAEAVGRHLAFVPFTASALLAPGALLMSGDGDRHQPWLAGLADGRITAAVALGGLNGRIGPDQLGFTARTDGDEVIVTGRADYVPDAGAADLLLLACRADVDSRDAEGVTFVAVEAGTRGLMSVTQATFDLTRRFATVTAEEIRLPTTAILGRPARAGETYRRLVDRAATATAADSLGALERMLTATVQHATNRVQFGRPIGSFQAVKHLCADMAIRAACSRAAVALAAERDDSSSASVAKSFVAEAAARVAGDAVQVHGGIGFTWEHDAHLYLRRVKANQALFGDTRWHRDRLAGLAVSGVRLDHGLEGGV